MSSHAPRESRSPRRVAARSGGRLRVAVAAAAGIAVLAASGIGSRPEVAVAAPAREAANRPAMTPEPVCTGGSCTITITDTDNFFRWQITKDMYDVTFELRGGSGGSTEFEGGPGGHIRTDPATFPANTVLWIFVGKGGAVPPSTDASGFGGRSLAGDPTLAGGGGGATSIITSDQWGAPTPLVIAGGGSGASRFGIGMAGGGNWFWRELHGHWFGGGEGGSAEDGVTFAAGEAAMEGTTAGGNSTAWARTHMPSSGVDLMGRGGSGGAVLDPPEGDGWTPGSGGGGGFVGGGGGAGWIGDPGSPEVQTHGVGGGGSSYIAGGLGMARQPQSIYPKPWSSYDGSVTISYSLASSHSPKPKRTEWAPGKPRSVTFSVEDVSTPQVAVPKVSGMSVLDPSTWAPQDAEGGASAFLVAPTAFQLAVDSGEYFTEQ